MAGNRTLKLTYLSDASQFKKGTQDAESSLSKLGDGFKKFGKVAAVGAAAAAAGILAFAKKSVDAAIEAEAAQARLETILTNTGLATQEQIKGLNEQAIALEKVGVASASNITVLQSQLATFDLTADTIQTLTPAIVDYVIAEKGAAATAEDFQSATNGLAQALQGNFGSLTRTGFVLDDVTKELISNGTEAERAAALIDVLGSTYEGFNEAARETSEGQLVALKNSFSNLQETVGNALIPVFRDLVEATLRIVERLQELWEIHGPAIIEFINETREKAVELVKQFRERFEPVLRDVAERVVELWQQFQEALTRFREWWTEVGPGVLDSFRRLKQPLIDVWNAVKDLWNNVKELFGAFRSGESDGQGFQRFIDGLVGAVFLLVQAIQFVIDVLNRLLDVVRRVVESKAFQALLSGIGSIVRGVGGFLSGRVPGLAEGGIVTRPTLAMVGEGGEPEAVIPLSKMGQFGGGGVNITINGAIDPEGTARQIRRILEDSQRRTGAVLNYAA
jgi:hypothetical protein